MAQTPGTKHPSMADEPEPTSTKWWRSASFWRCAMAVARLAGGRSCEDSLEVRVRVAFPSSFLGAEFARDKGTWQVGKRPSSELERVRLGEDGEGGAVEARWRVGRSDGVTHELWRTCLSGSRWAGMSLNEILPYARVARMTHTPERVTRASWVGMMMRIMRWPISLASSTASRKRLTNSSLEVVSPRLTFLS